MTEQEWLTCTRAKPMLELLGGKASERKLRLFALECCARVSHLLQEEGRQALAYVERYAEGAIKPTTLRKHLLSVESTRESRIEPYSPQWFATLVVEHVVSRSAVVTPEQCAQFVPFALATSAGHSYGGDSWMAASRGETAVLCHLLRCIFGNPFHSATSEPGWLTPTVNNLATGAYEERILPSGELDPARLGVLADALLDAGCTDATILDHLRSPGPHVRGCFAVDLMIPKE
jgi:hypothetical protein